MGVEKVVEWALAFLYIQDPQCAEAAYLAAYADVGYDPSENVHETAEDTLAVVDAEDCAFEPLLISISPNLQFSSIQDMP